MPKQPAPVDTRHALTIKQATQLLQTCDGDSPIDLRDRAMFVVGLETGMRRMSLVSMTLDLIDKSRGYPVAHVLIKGNATRHPVPLSDAAMAALEPWRRWLRAQKISTGPVFRAFKKGMDSKGKITYTPGGALAPVSIYKIVEHRAEQAGLDDVHPHIFHNTFIAWRMQAGMSPLQIAAITGHKMANIPGMAAMGAHVDITRLGGEARQSTPAWLSDFVRNA